MCNLYDEYLAGMKGSSILTETLDALRMGERRVVHQGGQYSGKTVNILGALAVLASEEGGDDSGVTTVTSMSMPHLKGGALRDFELLVYPTFKGAIKQYHRTDHVFYFKSGSIIEFKCFETEMDARGGKRKRLFCNEVNSMNSLVFFQLDSRSEQTLVDYNPSIRFFVHDEIIGKPGNRVIYSDHRHNLFLTEEKHREIENICKFVRYPNGTLITNMNGDPIVESGNYELWKVYARGLTGNIQGVIFPNWTIIDDSDFPEDSDYIFSMDFGYTNDPSAIIKQVLIGNTLFIKELAYETGLPPKSAQQILKAHGYKDRMPLYCEHDPDMIKALRKLGVNALFARKGQGSVKAGIELLNTYDVKYTASSSNLHRERGKYIWEITKDGRTTNEPVDNHNHTFDAIRYGCYTKYLRDYTKRA